MPKAQSQLLELHHNLLHQTHLNNQNQTNGQKSRFGNILCINSPILHIDAIKPGNILLSNAQKPLTISKSAISSTQKRIIGQKSENWSKINILTFFTHN